uniref:Uncharacterized protein n=1 Tax=Solanum tuberosum TaxID=4113 RepID=M1DBP0_SOLTU
MEASSGSSWRIADKIGEHESFCRLTHGTFSLDPVKLGGLKKISGASPTMTNTSPTSLEMARPKVAGRNDPPRHIRAGEFKKDEKKAELARQRKYTKEARAKRRIPIDPNVPLWDRSFVNAIHAFGEAHEIDQMIAANLAAEANAKANNENQNNNTLGTIVSLQGVTPSTEAQTDEATH